MKLTREDKEYLGSLGYKEKDFGMIAQAGDKTKFSLCESFTGESIRKLSKDEAEILVGRDGLLEGLAYSSYHQETNIKTINGGNLVHFDSTALFE